MKIPKSNFKCMDCKVDTAKINEYYMVRDDLWLKANPKRKGMLCIGCLENRLDPTGESHLNFAAFPHMPLNCLPIVERSERLWERMMRFH